MYKEGIMHIMDLNVNIKNEIFFIFQDTPETSVPRPGIRDDAINLICKGGYENVLKRCRSN